MTCHWSRTCRTSKHLVELYQASLKSVETNLTEKSDPLGIVKLTLEEEIKLQINTTHMEVADFFKDFNVNMAEFGGGNASIN